MAKPFDYDGDKVITAKDDLLRQADTNNDKEVTSAEKAAFAAKQSTMTANTEYDAEGRPVRTTTISPTPAEGKKTIADFGLTQAFVDRYPGIKRALEKAIEGDWSQDQFNKYVETQTDFGKQRTSTQELFDIAMLDPAQKPEYDKQIADTKNLILNQAAQVGVQISDAQANDFARRTVRNGLGQVDVRLFLGKQFELPTVGRQATGNAATLIDIAKQTAASYGIKVDDRALQAGVRDAIKNNISGSDWETQQRDYYRDQAKNLYPTVAPQLDKYTLKQILNPYLTEASDLLGIRIESMNLDDNRWTEALSGGANGGVMDANQWRKTLRTDPRYGYGNTTQAMNEAMDIGNQIIAEMGLV